MRSRSSKGKKDESDKDRGEDGMGWDGAKAKPRAGMESGQRDSVGQSKADMSRAGLTPSENPQHVCEVGLLHTDEPLSFAFHHHRSLVWKLETSRGQE